MSPSYLTFALKGAGAVFVLLAGVLLGNYKAREIETEALELKNLEIALLHLENQISYSLSPLPAALERSGRATKGIVGDIFTSMATMVGLEQGKTASEALEETFRQMEGETIPPSVAEILKDLVTGLGTTGHKEQLGYIHGFVQEVHAMRKRTEEKAQKKGRLFRYTGTLLAITIIILLI